MSLLALVACNTARVPLPIPVTILSKPISVVDVAPDNQIYDLLDAAHLALQDERLTTPFDDNAYDRYLHVLTLDPQNLEAKQGISAIVDQYLTWAVNKANQGQHSKAKEYLHRARAIDKNHPDIAAVAMRLSAEKRAKANFYDLAPQALANRSATIRQQLESIAKQIQATGAQVVIKAQSDSDGRWIYQQLNKFTRLRVRAKFELGPSPSIGLKPAAN